MPGFREEENEKNIDNPSFGGRFPHTGGTRHEESQDTVFQNEERSNGFHEKEHCPVTWRKMCLLSQCT
jgi:hypothetical protein